MRFLVFQHSPLDHPGVIRDYLKEDGIAWDAIDTFAGQPIPPLEDYAALIIMGGPQQTDQEAEHPWLAVEKDFIRRTVEENAKPVLGICLGSQLIAEVTGGSVGPMAQPEIGVLDSWATVLGLEGEPANADTYYKVYDVGPTEAGDLGRRILERVKPLGQESVIFYGDETTVVSKLGIGTGAIANPFKMVELGADALLCTDDPLHTTSELGWCLDMGVPVFVVNHATAEVTGIAHLATYVAQQFSDVPVEHLPQGCMYSTIS